jgi:hypothetical protein
MENGQKIKTHEDLRVYQMAFDAAIKIFELSRKFPIEDRRTLFSHRSNSSLL